MVRVRTWGICYVYEKSYKCMSARVCVRVSACCVFYVYVRSVKCPSLVMFKGVQQYEIM